ncbi:MAG: ROK family protein, partial [Bacteroidales bacterium]|nr:ROK family protein [Bacteroidales bacterium]
MKDKQFVVGIDVGGQTSKLGVVDARGDVLAQTVIRSDTYGADADAFLGALAEAVKGVIKEA